LIGGAAFALAIDERAQDHFIAAKNLGEKMVKFFMLFFRGETARARVVHKKRIERDAVGPRENLRAENVQAVGSAVFTTYLFAFEATAALLIIAVVGAVLLARRDRTGELLLEGADA
jgi:NADH:ubiquinone oxidoreductase subunit 6 (subunit J)